MGEIVPFERTPALVMKDIRSLSGPRGRLYLLDTIFPLDGAPSIQVIQEVLQSGDMVPRSLEKDEHGNDVCEVVGTVAGRRVYVVVVITTTSPDRRALYVRYAAEG